MERNTASSAERGEGGGREGNGSSYRYYQLFWLIKSLSHAEPLRTNAQNLMTHTNTRSPLLPVPLGMVSKLFACLLPARAACL